MEFREALFGIFWWAVQRNIWKNIFDEIFIDKHFDKKCQFGYEILDKLMVRQDYVYLLYEAFLPYRWVEKLV